jgi:putative flippase GtrA
VQLDDAAPAPRGRATDHALRVGRGLRKPANWMQLVKFSTVGASGYIVNLAVYTTLVHALDVHYILAAVLAFCVAVTNNFLWNRHWTFRAADGHMGFQAALILELLVSAGVEKVLAQALAILAATPLNFIGNKLWSFGDLGRPHLRRRS